MRKSTMGRYGLMGSVAALALAGTVSGAQAYSTKYGDFEITLDTTVSVGASMRVTDRNNAFLNESAGGNIDPRSTGPGAVVTLQNPYGAGNNVFPFTLPTGSPGLALINSIRTSAPFLAAPLLSPPGVFGQFVVTNNNDNFDNGINGDDGRLNFDNGDLIGAPAKASHDLLVKWHNLTLFARAIGFYDFVLNEEDAGNRSTLTERARGDVGRNYELLDLYVSGDFNVAGLPVNLRAGKQVISWGESTFIQNGINVFNPFDVSAFRRPGAEIKEGLVPVNALYGSVSLPFSVSVAGFYALDWEPVEIDPAGTPFSGADVINDGSGIRGNINRNSYISGSPFAGPRRNCTATNVGAAPTDVRTALYQSGLLTNPFNQNGLNNPLALNTGVRPDCGDSPFINYNTPVPLREAELQRNLLVASGQVSNTGAGIITRGADFDADDGNQWGLTIRHYNEDLGAEFGLYAMNYHSRLPFVSMTATQGELGIGVTGDSANITPRTLARPFSEQVSALASRWLGSTGALAPTAVLNLPYALSGPGTDPRSLLLATTPIADPQNLINATSIATAVTLICQTQETVAPGACPIGTLPGLIGTAVGQGDTYLNAIRINQVLNVLQSSPLTIGGVQTGRVGLLNGSETFAVNPGINLNVSYPEDIRLYGLSFNTTIAGWGVQGEVSYRPDAPFQQDTDQMTIASAGSECAFMVAGSNVAAVFEALGTGTGGSCNFASVGNKFFNGVLNRDMITAQVGTTATFTGSDWMIEAIGADFGVLLTEFGIVHVEGVEDTWLTNDNGTYKAETQGVVAGQAGTVVNSARWVQFQNTGCQGSDLPLGSLLTLDFKTSRQCRPTDVSAGYVLLARATYNNFMGTGYALSPTMSFSHDFYGTTPAPYGNYLKDRMSGSFSVQAELNNNFRMSASYTNFWGGHVNNKSQDQDFISLSAAYSF